MRIKSKQFLTYYILPMLAGFLLMWFLLYKIVHNWQETAVDAFITTVTISAMILIIDIVMQYYRPPVHKIQLLAFWMLVLGTTGVFLSQLINTAFASEEYQLILQSGFMFRLFIFNIILFCFGLFIWIKRQNSSAIESNKRYFEVKQLARDAELNTLRQQLQPHFLFNSLNSIYAMVGDDDKAAKKMILQLGDFLRGSIRKHNEDRRTWAEELQHAELYLEIEKVRFSDRLSINKYIEDEIKEMPVPAQILQPVLENAVKFSIYHTHEQAVIRLSITKKGLYSVAEISNTFSPEYAATGKGTGYGLSSLKRRLALIYNRNDLVSTRIENGLFTTQISIPTVS